MLVIRFRNKKNMIHNKYDIILVNCLSRRNYGKSILLGSYIPFLSFLKLNKVAFSTALNEGAQLSNGVRLLLKKFIKNKYN